MSDMPDTQHQERSKGSHTTPGFVQARLPGGKESALRLFLMPILLVFLGVWLGLAALKVYPRTIERPSPSFPHIFFTTNYPLSGVIYRINQVSKDKSVMMVELDLADQRSWNAATAAVSVTPADGTVFVGCPESSTDCKQGWAQTPKFNRKGVAASYFTLKSGHFGVNYNGLDASAALPEIDEVDKSAGSPTLYAGYYLPSASSYDWSLYPPYTVGPNRIVWNEALGPGDTIGRGIAGANHAAHASDDIKVFIAGALAALAGAAVLTALIEALHVRDWAALRAVHRQ
jgi:hypothetical protein